MVQSNVEESLDEWQTSSSGNGEESEVWWAKSSPDLFTSALSGVMAHL
jgi:hypothetical protein